MNKHCYTAFALGLLVAGSLAGCGGQPQSDRGEVVPASSSEPAGETPSPSPSNPPASPAVPAAPPLAATPSGSKGALTLRGLAEAGVEAGCVVLTAEDGRSYLLVGGDRSLIAPGGRLEVVGEPQPDLMTTCQQGTPFRVVQVRRI